jgi:hypothetical protein
LLPPNHVWSGGWRVAVNALPAAELSAIFGLRRHQLISVWPSVLVKPANVGRSQPCLPFHLERLDRLNGIAIIRRITNLLFEIDSDLSNSHFDFRFSVKALPDLRLLLATLERATLSTTNILRVVPKNRYPLLNGYLSNYLSRLSLPGRTANELILLSHRMAVRGRGLVGDVVQMTPQQVIACAMTVPAVRNPEKIVAQLEKALAQKGLMFCMRAPGWVRNEGPTMEQLIAARDARREFEAQQPKRLRPQHLHLVP